MKENCLPCEQQRFADQHYRMRRERVIRECEVSGGNERRSSLCVFVDADKN